MMPRNYIGGELEAAFVCGDATVKLPFASMDSLWMDSGRGALVALLRQIKKKGMGQMVHLPEFICESVVLAVECAGLPYKTYSVGKDLEWQVTAKAGEVVFGVHYFGFINPSLCDALHLAKDGAIIIEDCAQALLTTQLSPMLQSNHYRLFSPRKFLGVPAGGYLEGLVLSPGEIETTGSIDLWKAWTGRCLKALYRSNADQHSASEVESLYIHLMDSFEKHLDAHPGPRALPSEVLEILKQQDYVTVAKRRCSNYRVLLENLPASAVPLFSKLPPNVVPLGLPVLFGSKEQKNEIRGKLKNAGIFCASHWPQPKQLSSVSPFAEYLYDCLLTLPVDQRYSSQNMQCIAKTLGDILCA